MVNFTNPSDPSYEDKEEDYIASALVFCRALGFILQENEGIVITKVGEIKKWKKFSTDKLIVYKRSSQINIIECEQDLKDGQIIWVSEEEDKAKRL